MEVILGPLARLVIAIVDIYIWIVVIGVIMSWLVALNVINTSNRFVYLLADFLYRVTEPALKPIRNLLPNLGGFDVSPIVLILALYFLEDILIQVMMKLG
jgi:YggT family protein